jgi:DNA-binding beta-propeller fold protein YncE
MYVLDRENRQVVCVNSNRFTVLDTVRVSDPVSMSMAPSLGVLAVANFASSTVSFIDTDPRNATFNTIVAETRVPDGPTKVAWQPDGEALLAVSRDANTLTVISGGDFSVINVASGSLVNPVDLAVSERYVAHGNTSGVYYAYVLNENGTVAVYESGPSGVNGIGFEDMIGTVELQFRRARRIKLDYVAPQGGFYVAHTDDSGVGMVSGVELTSTPVGPQATQQNSGGFVLPPTFRQKTWSVTRAFGGSDPSVPGNQRLSGNSPSDICVDEMLNSGGFPNQTTPNAGTRGTSIIGHSSKGAILNSGGGVVNPYTPRFLFVAVSDVGRIDVIDLNSKARVRSLEVPGVQSLSTWWKQ